MIKDLFTPSRSSSESKKDQGRHKKDQRKHDRDQRIFSLSLGVNGP